MLLAAAATVSVLYGGTHADGFVAPAINAVLGAGHVDTDIFVDTTGDPPPFYINLPTILGDTTRTHFRVANNAPVNHALYPVGGFSQCVWTAHADQDLYPGLAGSGQILTWAYGANPTTGCGIVQPAGTPPGTVTATVSSSNSVNGAPAPGLEFALQANYLGLNTSADSWDTAALAGFFAALQWQHPTWNGFDLKGAFRQTAANWATGFDETRYGYGVLNYAAATALPSPASLYLQPPGVRYQQPRPDSVIITLYPYRQSRRDHEVIYAVSPAYVWPIKNEYTAADVAASGGTLLYTSNGTDLTPTFLYAPATSGSVTLVEFTVDAAAHYSRVEAFSTHTVSFLVGSACLQ